MKYNIKVSCDFPIVGVAEVEADTEKDALVIATERYGKDKKNFNVEIISEEEAAEAVHRAGNIRQSSGGDNPTGSDVGLGSQESSEEAPVKAE